MILLTSTSDLLRLVTSAAAALDVHVSFVDNATGTITAGRTNTAITTATITTVCASPGASTARNVQTLAARNKSSTVTTDVTVLHTDGTTIVEMFKASLRPGFSLYFVDGEGFELCDTTGAVVQTTAARAATGFYDAQADFGLVGDLVTVFDGACSTGAPTKITSATASFTTLAVVNQRITLAGAGASGAVYVGTITNIDSATQVTVSPSISTTVSTKGLQWGTDNTTAAAAMVTAINASTFPVGTVFFGRSATNSFGFPARMVFNKPVQFQGIGGSHTADSGDYTRSAGTRLAWWGTSFDGGTAFAGFIEMNPTGAQSLKRPAFRSCWLDCRNGDQNEALFGLKLYSAHGFLLQDFFVIDALASSIWINVGTTPTEARDSTRFLMSEVCSRQLDAPQAGAMTTPILMTSAVALSATPQSLTVAANTLPASGYMWTMTANGYPVLVNYTGGGGTTTLTGCSVSAEDAVNTPTTVNGGNVVQASPGNASCMQFDGSTTANTCCGLIEMIQLSHGTTWGPAALDMRNCDSIQFIQPVINGGNITNDGAINRVRKPGVRLNGSNTNTALASRNNMFRGGSAGAGGASNMGVLNSGARLLAMAGPNYWDLYEMGNGEGLPVAEGNSAWDWSANGLMRATQRGVVSVANQAVTAATLTLITGSVIQIPPQGWQIGTVIRWKVRCSKTAAGVAARNWFLRVGTAGTTADAVIATFASGTPTAVADNAVVDIQLNVRGPLGGACAGVAHLHLLHGLAATGFSTLPVEINVATMATWNSALAQAFVHLSLTTGAAEAITVQTCGVEVVKPANP